MYSITDFCVRGRVSNCGEIRGTAEYFCEPYDQYGEQKAEAGDDEVRAIWESTKNALK